MEFYPRTRLTHARPAWVKESDPIFITICCKSRTLNQLAREEPWRSLVDSAESMRAGRIWNPHLMVAMPDHVHLIAEVPRNPGISKAIRLFKSKTAYAAKVRWQRGAFDHRIRHEAAAQAKWEYVLMNPVRANLCAAPENWPYAKIWPRNDSP